MDTTQIHHVLSNHPSTKSCFKGVFASDEFPNKINRHRKQCYVVNTDPSSKPGLHWVAFYYSDGEGFFFDSYGNPPDFYKHEFKEHLDRNADSWTYNTKRLQGTMSSVCGQYCIFFLIKRCRSSPKLSYSHILRSFGRDYDRNDKKVNTWFNHTFKVTLPVHDVDFTVRQVARSFDE